MNDRLDTTTTFDASDADDRIDALARSAGSALRRPADAGRLARIHRAKRNHQIARATGGAAAVLAVVGGAVVLMNRGGEERLVPATVPSTVVVETLPTTAPVTVGSTVPTSSPSTTQVTSPVTTPVTSPVTDPPVTTSPPVNTATGEQPTVVYVGTQTTGTDEQQVIDLATGQVIRTEPMEQDPSLTANPPVPESRTTSASGIEYGTEPGSGDGCGQRPLLADGAGVAGSALPEIVSGFFVSDDGRYLITISVPDCPSPGPIGNGSIFDITTPYDQEIHLFDADDTSAAGRLLATRTFPDWNALNASFSADGRFVALLTSWEAGVRSDESRFDVEAFDLETGAQVDLPQDRCDRYAPGWNYNRAFVGEQSVIALTKRCADGYVLEVVSLYEPADVARFDIPGVDPAAPVAVTAEVWENSLTSAGDAAFVVLAIDGIDPSASSILVRQAGGGVEELPFAGNAVSFLPIREDTGS